MERRTNRRPSAGKIYHVFSRGVGKQIIFEDDKDRNVFLKIIEKSLAECGIELLAWCLMDNHFHFLLRGDVEAIARFMQRTLSQYAQYYNCRYEREGHVFQSRYGSEPIDSESYLLQAVRYIHQNPEKAAIAPTDRYRWSSYQEYIHAPRITTTAPLLEMFGTVAAFANFHQQESQFSLQEYDDSRGEAAFKRATQIAIDELGEFGFLNVRALPRAERDNAVTRLANRGLTQRQIERLTGVSRKTVASILRETPPLLLRA